MAKIFVGCKLPNGLIMELVKPHPFAGSINPLPTGPRVTLNGANTAALARTNPADAQYGVTEVEESFWNAWLEANKEAKYITNKHVFAAKTRVALEDEAKAMFVFNRTNLEPLKTDGSDPRQQQGVEADAKQLKRLGAVA